MKPIILQRQTPDPALKLRERMEAQRLMEQGINPREAQELARQRHLPFEAPV